jgi:DNA-binding FadR family transcriptional regulator
MDDMRDRLALAERVVEAARDSIVGNRLITSERFPAIREAIAAFDASKD